MRFIFCFPLFLLSVSSLFSQSWQKPQKPYITREDEFMRVLIIFAQFGSDSTHCNDWEPDRLPDWAHSFIDSDPESKFRTFTLSDYWHTMSTGKFKFVGDIYDDLVILPPESDYSARRKSFGDANLDLLKRIDEKIDWERYDNWSYDRVSKRLRFESDGSVDMVYIIYRNAGNWFGTFTAISKLGLTESYFTKENFEINGELGSRGSGITVRQGYRGKIDLIERCAHEYGHYLFGYFHTELGGIMGGGTYALTGWELERLGYVEPIIPKENGEVIGLDDLLSSGEMIKIPISAGNEDYSDYYLIENHQRISPYDQIIKGGALEGAFDPGTKSGSGIYVWLIQNANRTKPKVELKAADGMWDWAIIDTVYDSPLCACDVPGFARTSVNRENGRCDREINITFNGVPWPMWYDFNYLTNEWVLTRNHLGDEFDAFNPGYCEIFSAWSNPASKYGNNYNIGFQLLDRRGDEIIIKLFSDSSSIIGLPPSKPQLLKAELKRNNIMLSWAPNIEPDMHTDGYYKIFRAINSEDPRQISSYPAGSKSINDPEGILFYSETVPDSAAERDTLRYYIIAVDRQKLESLPSEKKAIVIE